MLLKKDENIIIQTANRYGAFRVILFGSSLDQNKESADIDIAVEGIPSKLFFKFYGDLMFNLSKPLDIVDLSQNNSFTNIIRRDGLVIYGEP